ncbi:hypothetical protein BFG52_13610 [Acinetobacter larvae]|uniref:Outer membrane lipoprotein carrier protein LolA n=2 Tax=Acinetobacter larvae TaxID=1789224 RepID=A0A1B2M472_9GAMM|nr:hypothetical protein BFG52_13610 [Acinetobacter larvae]
MTHLVLALFCCSLGLSTTALQAQSPVQSNVQSQMQNNDLNKIFQQLAATAIVRANFEQKKQLTGVNKSFVSNGSVVFSKAEGVLWKMQRPVQADLIVTQHKLVQKTQRSMSQIAVDKSPYASVATMFLQLMAGNSQAIAQNFDVVSVQYTPQQWKISLTPKSNLFKKLFVRVDAVGGRYVDHLLITEQGQNSTAIRFTGQSSQPQQLTAHENALFQLAK